MMAQWESCKKQAPDALLLFRLGDFYEAFYDDAKKISKEIGLTLTARQGIPMCGVPFHASDTYIDKLIARGHRVAIAEQTEDPKAVKGLVKREIVRLVSPGTIVGSNLLSDKRNNFFACVCQIGSIFGLAVLDITTGEFRTLEAVEKAELIDELHRLRPSEILLSSKFKSTHGASIGDLSHSWTFVLNEREEWRFDPKSALAILLSHFKVESLDSFGLKGQLASIAAAGALVGYLQQEMSLRLDHVLSIKADSAQGTLALDRSTLRNLELAESAHENGEKHTLIALLDETATPMGGRLLRHWLKHPLLSIADIQKRQEAIAEIMAHSVSLQEIRDIERLMMKVAANYAMPRDLLALGLSAAQLPKLQEALSPFKSELIAKNRSSLIDPISAKILSSLTDSPPLRIGEGDLFRDGIHPELDQLRTLSRDSVSWMAQYQTRLREETGIKTLKVGFTRAFGYYIEASRAQSEKIPASFQRRQTLVNGERFITDELKHFEHQALTAEERAKALETELFEILRREIAQHAQTLFTAAKAVGEIDALFSLATVAADQNWVRPTVDESDKLEIYGGRHPIVESVVGKASFIPNDTLLSKEQQLMLITGPNMAGKSTYIRQVALIAILAQIGSFVPATSAHIGLIDKIFSRIGASDDLARGQSTFMVEMAETANILHNATSRSLVLLDEIGRGTSTYDGISIAWAVAEFLLTTPNKQAKTLFATHYWELTRLEQELKGAVNHQVAVQETADGIVFLRKIIRGGTDKSYGIHVAKLAGLPYKAIQRAETMLKQLETKAPKKPPKQEAQLSLLPQESPDFTRLLDKLKSSDLDRLTPLEALLCLHELKSLTHNLLG